MAIKSGFYTQIPPYCKIDYILTPDYLYIKKSNFRKLRFNKRNLRIISSCQNPKFIKVII